MKRKQNIDSTIQIQENATSCCNPAVSSKSCCGLDKVPDTQITMDFKKILTSLWSVWTFILLIPTLVFILDQGQLLNIVQIASSALAGTAPYIIFAVLLLAYLKATKAENLVSQAFQGKENRMIVLAALFGGLAPFCSCEVIPFVAGLLALGAPISAVMAFWLSSPLIDPPSLMITAGALGWEFATGKAVAAVFLGLMGGFGIKLMTKIFAFNSPLKPGKFGACSSNTCGTEKTFSGKPNWKFWNNQEHREIFATQSIENAIFLFKWLSLAYLFEALLITYIPASLIGGIVGGEGVGPVILGALVGMPAYLNSYAAPALVAGLMEQGMSSGSAMAFMVSGSISSIPAMTAVWSLVKKQVFFAYLGFGISGAIIFGLIFGNYLGA
ncbi:MAG: permease [Sedimenticola sp.]